MNGKYIRLTPPPPPTPIQGFGFPAEAQFAQFDPKTLYLIDGAEPIVLGRASKHLSSGRPNDPDNGYLRVPTGKTALGAKHALVCLRNGTLYIAMKERDGLVSPTETMPPREVAPHSEYLALRSGARVRLGVAGAASPGVTLLVDIVFHISDVDVWRIPLTKQHKSARFIRDLPGEEYDSDGTMAMDIG